VKTLPEVLRDAMLLLLGEGREHVVIARGHDGHEPLDGRGEAYQMRLRHDVDLNQYRCEARSWLGEQWSSWREHRGWLGGAGFDIYDVLATDWRIAS
jgi:hypothetical protein